MDSLKRPYPDTAAETESSKRRDVEMAQNGDTQPNGSRSIAQDLFEDMGRKVDQTNGEDQKVVEEIESLCMNCHEDGITKLLLTKIPFFREVVIMSFACDHCGHQSNEIQSAGEIQPKGSKHALRVEKDEDLQRQVVKSDVCLFRIEDIDLEIPAGKGQYTNIEGIISAVRDDLSQHQEARMEQMPEVGVKVAGIISALSDMLEGRKYPFMISADDPSGNSSIEPRPGDSAGKWAKTQYNRTPAQNGMLGLGDDVPNPASDAPPTEMRPEYHSSNLVGADSVPTVQGNNVDQEEDIVEDQVYSFPASCPGCTRPCATNMKMVNIPYFKQVVLMSTVCDHCGYRSNEVKTGGEVPEKGRRITLKVSTNEDLARDILKSESASLFCPELQLRVEPGTMGGRFTTVEGIMTQIRKDLRAQAFGLEDGDAQVPEGAGDSMTSDSKKLWEDFFAALTDAIEGKKGFTLTLEDPLAGSYVQSLTAPEPDPKIEVQDYERTKEEEEDLGLADIKTEGYEQVEEEAA
ncbi:Zinc finger protein [Fulvia fulva]|nr:Zinc finger protein [Fulvia fulva]WPV18214.1 Zinc finger protein [Fulvia fulva]WPV32948.1 Zinc finger protein [Fulvia fulva]